MTFTTLQYNGVEKPLADWGIGQASRETTNQANDHFACDVMLAADAADPFPYGAQITLRIGRVSTVQPATTPAGLPVSGLTGFSGGTTWFIGWRVANFRAGSPQLEKLAYKFAGPWEFFFERLVFQKLWWTWNGTQNVADWRSQIVLGLSANALVGVNNTVPGASATNLMSIAQQVREIAAYVMTQTAVAYGAPQIQLDGITAGGDGVYRPNWDTSGNYKLYTSLSGTSLIIPDFIAGVYASGAPSNPTSVNTLLSSNAPGTIALANTVLRAPLDSVNDITCAEAMRKMLRWAGAMGDPVLWFDYTTTPPTLHISTRDMLPSVSLPFPSVPSVPGAATPLTGPQGPFYASASKIKRRDDLIPTAVELKFRLTGTWNGEQYTQVIRDVAGTVGGTKYEGIGLTGALYTLGTFATGSPAYVGGGANSATMQALQAAGQGFAAQSVTIDMEGNSSSVVYGTIATIGVNTGDPAGGGGALAFWKAVFPEINDLTSPAFVPNAVVSVLDDSGASVDTSVVQYLLTDGQIAPWMLAGNSVGGTPVQCKQCTITAAFTGTENNNVGLLSGSTITDYAVPTGHAQNHQKHARVTLLTIPGGTYSRQNVAPGEIVPFGLAGYIYNIASIPQYEGTFSIQEQEVTDQCPMGYNLNLTGSLSEWSTMNAAVQSVFYDLTAGRTVLTFGPAAHLGAKDFVERLRVNRGPRWYNLNGNNVTNDNSQQRGTQLGNNVAQRGPSPGPRAADLQTFPISLADLAANGSSYTAGVPGATIDTRASGQPNYGNISGLSAPNAPTIMLASGSAGSLGQLVRITPADLNGKGPAWFQEVGICVNISGVPTPKNIMVLCTAPF
jgi:hypothetical protein